MLTDQQTAQLVRDIQTEFPRLAVTRSKYSNGDHVVIVHDPTNRNEVRITSLRGYWRTNVAAMDSTRRVDEPGSR